MTGIIERLRTTHAIGTMREAADEIESLREQLATAQAAYLQFTEASDAKLAKAVAALEGAKTWLSGWASAEPYLSKIEDALEEISK